jgi:hypothetical protein
MCKLWGTEMAWQIVDETMQIRGGRGYETADSLRARGEEPIAVERFMRDCRINTIFEGSSEIMRLFLAREALDPHLKVSGAALNSQLPMGQRVKAALKAATFYSTWYPRQWLPRIGGGGRVHAKLRRHLRFASRASQKLARSLFHSMAKFGPKLERQQVLLGRFVDIGTEIFALSATCSRAQSILDKGNSPEAAEVLKLADYFCKSSRLRIERHFHGLGHNLDADGYKLAQDLLKSDATYFEDGIIRK